MNILDKSNELGIDLAQIALSNYGLTKCIIGGTFHCFTVSNGEEQNIYIYDNNGIQIHDGFFRWSNNSLNENSTLIQVESEFKNFINSITLIPFNNSIIYEDLQ